MIFSTTRTKENLCTIERASDAARKKEEDFWMSLTKSNSLMGNSHAI